MGHKNEDVGIINHLSEGFPLAPLKAIIEQEQLDLSMITRRFDPEKSKPRGLVLVTDNEKSMPQARSA